MLLWLLACADEPCATTTFFVDADGDGFGGAETTKACAWEAGLSENDADCDDQDAAVFPEAVELCNDRDDDCDALVDEDAADQAFWYPDTDEDGFGTADDVQLGCDAPPGYVAEATDCDGADPAVHPGADEWCDGVDQDCDGAVDEDAVDAPDWYTDTDLDGFGDASTAVLACDAPEGTVADAGDCDDTRADLHPGMDELCNELDDDCDGAVDEDAIDPVSRWTDADGDGFGDPATEVVSCTPGDGVESGGDCDDADPEVSPAADERCDGLDNNCDGAVDEASAVDALGWYLDNDGDGYGEGDPLLWSCVEVYGHVSAGGDCDDDDADFNPAATDVPANRYDEDCDGTIDCYADADADGYGGLPSVASVDTDCRDAGESYYDQDCDDTDPGIHEHAGDIAYDGIDQDCDGSDLADVDLDGHDATVVGGDDCDDDDADVHPGAAEACDGHDVDEDCDGLADEADPDLPLSTWYVDLDGDGFGDPATAVSAACPPADLIPFAGDCDDTDADIHPGAPEACDATADQNCDGSFGDADLDGDGVIACEDCNDADAAAFPGATELLNGADDDCDALIDEYVGDLTISSVAEAQALCETWQSVEGNVDLDGVTTFRDLSCLRAVSGYIRIGGVTATDLDGLQSLTTVGGDLLIGGWLEDGDPLDFNTLRSLNGLDRLREVGGHLRVCESYIDDLSPLGRVKRVGGSFVLLDLQVTEVTIPMESVGADVHLEELNHLESVSHGALTSLPGALWIESDGGLSPSDGFSLDWDIPIGGTLALRLLQPDADQGWSLPDTVGGLHIQGNDLVDLDMLSGLRVVEGDVDIQNNFDLVDVSALDGLTYVGGDFGFWNNDVLSDTGEFAALTTIGGWLRVQSENPVTVAGFNALTELGSGVNLTGYVTDITGFAALTETPTLWLDDTDHLADTSGLARIRYTQDVTIESTSSLTDLSVLGATTSLTGNLAIRSNSQLADLRGAEGITSVGAALTIEDNSTLTSLDGLDDLAAIGGALTLSDLKKLPEASLPALTTVGGDIALDNLDALETVDGLAPLTHIGGLWVNSCGALRNLDGLTGITTVDGSVILDTNPVLATLGGLQNLTVIGGNLDVQNNGSLVDLVGLDALTTVGGTLSLKRNSAFERPNSLAALTEVGGDLWVQGNGSLEDMGGLGALTIGGALYFYDNVALTSLYGLDGVSDVGGNLVIANEDRLDSLEYLSGLTHVGGDIRIGFNALLPDLHGLESVVTVDGDVEIGLLEDWSTDFGWHDSLTTLDGLDGLTAIGGDLHIVHNPVLNDLDGLGQIVLIGGDLVVTDNPVLLTALIDAFRYGGVNLGGEAIVRDNG